MKIYHFDENSSLGQRFFTLMKDLSVMKIHKCDKKKTITAIKKIKLFDENFTD